jgi:parallel beta-helix repeat protein
MMKRILSVAILLLMITAAGARTTIYTSQIGGVAGLAHYGNLSDCTVYFDMEEETDYTIVLTNVENAVFDGMQTALVCKSTLFRIDGGCKNIEICHFNAEAKRGTTPDFQCMTSSNNKKVRQGIHIHDNYLRGFSMAISLGADNVKPGKGVRNSKVYNNRIIGTMGTTPGKGYGIHLANARNCEVYNNHVENTTRHAIYHAWGEDNKIWGNTIVHHRMTVDFNKESTGIIKGAVAIFRDSQNILVANNTFIDNYNVSIHVYSFPDPSYMNEAHYADMHGIKIQNNHFVNNGVHTVNTGPATEEVDYPAIMIGFNAYNPYTASHRYFINDVTINNNKFENLNTNCQQCIRMYECSKLNITENEFVFSHRPDIRNSKFWYLISLETDYKAYTSFTANITRNTFTTQNTQSGTNVYIFNEFANFKNYPRNKISVEGNTFANQQASDGLRYKLYYP